MVLLHKTYSSHTIQTTNDVVVKIANHSRLNRMLWSKRLLQVLLFNFQRIQTTKLNSLTPKNGVKVQARSSQSTSTQFKSRIKLWILSTASWVEIGRAGIRPLLKRNLLSKTLSKRLRRSSIKNSRNGLRKNELSNLFRALTSSTTASPSSAMKISS